MPFTKHTLLVWREAANIKFHEKTGEYHLEHFTTETPKPIQKVGTEERIVTQSAQTIPQGLLKTYCYVTERYIYLCRIVNHPDGVIYVVRGCGIETGS